MKQSNPQPVCPVSPALPEAFTPAKALPVKTGLQAGCGHCTNLSGDAFWRCMNENPAMAC
jgi:hypothetical protein